jgi:quercetin dioxygenase-like cupin family protein
MKMKRIICSIGIVGLVLGLANFVMPGEEPKIDSSGKGLKGVFQVAQPPAPKVIYQASLPVVVKAGDYDLLTVVQDFPPGSGVPPHFHGGYVLVTVLNGEMTLKEKGRERIIRSGESWTENPGDLHSVVNAGATAARVVVNILLPKGAEATTIIKQ